MDLNNLDDIEYKYIFEIDSIKRAVYLCIKVSANLKNLNLEKSDFHRLKQYIKDFKLQAFKIINKSQILTSDDYVHSVDTLTIINLKIQSILGKHQYKRKAQIQKAIDLFKQINKLLNAESPLRLFVRNHQTTIICLTVTLFIVVTLWLLISLDKAVAAVFSMIIILIITIFLPKVDSIIQHFDNDRKTRMLSHLTYSKSKKLQKIYNYSEQLLKEIKPNK